MGRGWRSEMEKGRKPTKGFITLEPGRLQETYSNVVDRKAVKLYCLYTNFLFSLIKS